jgi:hypothetical protein
LSFIVERLSSVNIPQFKFTLLVFAFLYTSAALAVFGLLSGSVIAAGPDSNFNLSQLTEGKGMDLKTLLSSFKPVNGTYTNPDFGFEIVFPQGWKGTEFSDPSGKVASVSSGERKLGSADFSGMGVKFLDNRNNEAISILSNLTSPLGASTSEGEEAKCMGLSFTPVTINSIKGEEGTYVCETVNPTTGSNKSIRTLDVTFATKDDSLIFISYYGSESQYDNDLPKFEESLKSVKISNPGDITSSATYSEYKKVLSQQANN